MYTKILLQLQKTAKFQFCVNFWWSQSIFIYVFYGLIYQAKETKVYCDSCPVTITMSSQGVLSVGRTASSEPPYASHTLVQINPQFIPKLSTQKYSTQILLSIDRMQMSIFLQKVKEALFGARCWHKQAESSNFNGLQDSRYLEVRLHGPNESISKRRKSHLHMSAGLYI